MAEPANSTWHQIKTNIRTLINKDASLFVRFHPTVGLRRLTASPNTESTLDFSQLIEQGTTINLVA